MDISVSSTSPEPLREQIVRRVRELILSGALPEHAQLASIRRTASTHRVSVMTVQRAFEDLERDGLIYARQGKGYFVAPLEDSTREKEAARLAENLLRAPLRESLAMGLPTKQLLALVRRLLEEEAKS